MNRIVIICAAVVISAFPDSLSADYDEQRGFPGLVSDAVASSEKNRERAHDFIKKYAPAEPALDLKNIALNDSRYERRRRAFEALKFYPSESITDVWIDVIDNSDSLIMKRDAIDHLQPYTSRSLVPVIAKQLESRYQAVRNAAAIWLENSGDDRVYPVILSLAESPDPVKRIYSIEAMFYLYDKRVSREFDNLLADENHSVRIYAIKCAVANDLAHTLPAIRNAARNDNNTDVRIAAIEALGDMRDARALNILSSTINDPSVMVRFKSAESAYKTGSVNAAGFLTRRLETEGDEEIINMILDSLISFRRVGAVGPVEGIIAGPYNVRIRIKSAYLLGIINNRRAVSPLVDAVFNDSDHRVRAEAAASLGNYGGRNTVNELINVVRNDEVRYVRSAALYSLKKINDRSALLHLFEIFAYEKDPVFRTILEESIVELIERYT